MRTNKSRSIAPIVEFLFKLCDFRIRRGKRFSRFRPRIRRSLVAEYAERHRQEEYGQQRERSRRRFKWPTQEHAPTGPRHVLDADQAQRTDRQAKPERPRGEIGSEELLRAILARPDQRSRRATAKAAMPNQAREQGEPLHAFPFGAVRPVAAVGVGRSVGHVFAVHGFAPSACSFAAPAPSRAFLAASCTSLGRSLRLTELTQLQRANISDDAPAVFGRNLEE